MNIKTKTMLLILALIAGLNFSCSKTDDIQVTLNIPTTLTFTENDDTEQIIDFEFTLDQNAPKDVLLTWSLTDGTAKAGEDYKLQTEVYTVIKEGTKSQKIEMVLYGNQIHQPERFFNLIVSNIKNATLTNPICRIVIQDNDPFIPMLHLPERVSIPEGNDGNHTLSIVVELTGPAVNPVSFNWSTLDGWAKSNEDYYPVSNQNIVFEPGQIEKTLEVSIIGDDIFEMDDYFDVVLNNITGAQAEKTTVRVYLENDDTYTPQIVDDGTMTPLEYPGMSLVWNDEFSGSSINTENWGYDLGGGGWGNNEWQVYTSSSENSFISNDKLNIRATKLYNSYNSARLLSKGKKEFTYGRIDIRARMPYGQGIWPALWMLGGNISQVGWPRCGEIDIMEYLGHEQSKTHGTIHYYENGHRYKGSSYSLSGNQSFHDDFHVFTIVWQENSVRWYVDYNLFYEVDDKLVVFDSFRLPHFFIMNVAVGGNWPGYPDETTVFPQIMEVDYIRVFQNE
jgi:beta-glucanase (GH16 family)